MSRKVNIDAKVIITKKVDPSVVFKGIITWSIGTNFGFEMYSNKLESFVKCELDTTEWDVKYL